MSEASETFSFNVYEEDLNEENHLDLSCQGLESVPEIKNLSLVAIYLQNNKLETLPEDFFPSLKFLMYLDLRDNRLVELPASIKDHQTLTHLLLQNNHLTSLPNELGTVNLKVLQLNGNPLIYPPREIINGGVVKILTYLYDKFLDNTLDETGPIVENDNESISPKSFKSVANENLKVKVIEKEDSDHSVADNEDFYGKVKKQCPKFKASRQKPPFGQSAKYLKALRADDKMTRDEKLKQQYKKELALQKHKELLATREKVLQERRNLETLKNWRSKYRSGQMFQDGSYRLKPESFPYDTNPEYLTLLSREDIEKDLPDKYRKNILRRSKYSVPRKSNKDAVLALKIKKMFEDLKHLDLNRDGMTPRTEQRVLLNEIHKITEIKQKLKELSSANFTTV